MKKLFIYGFGILFFLSSQSLYAYNNQWSNNEDYVVVKEMNVDPGEGDKNKEVKGAEPKICRSGSPVYLKSGHFTWSDTDIVLSGKPGLSFSRSYTSKEPLSGMFGNGWISNFESGFIETVRHLDNEDTIETDYILRKINGLRYTFKEINGTIEAPTGMYYTFKRLSSTSYSVTDENRVTELYVNDLLVSTTDANGNKVDYTYDENSLPQSIKDNNGNVLTLTFGGNGYVTAITDQNNRTWQYDYDGDGNLISVTDPMNGELQYEYEEYQADNDAQVYYHLTKITDETDKVLTEVVYNSGYINSEFYLNGRVASYTEGENTYTYNWGYLSRYNAVNKTDSLGYTTTMFMNESGHIVKYRDINWKLFTYNIDENMTLHGYTDKNGNTWQQSLDSLDRVILESTPLDANTTYKYTGDNHNPSAFISPLGRETKFSYDSHLNPTSFTFPNGTKYSWSYDSLGNPVEFTEPSGVKSKTITYNTKSLPLSFKDALGNTASFSYDKYSNPIKFTDAKGNVITFKYDLLGRLTKTINSLSHTMTYTYDITGRLLSLVDPVGNTTSYQYDSYGRLSLMKRADGRTFTYSYNKANAISKIIDSAGRETTFEYDNLGHMTKMIRGLSYIAYTYDAMGHITKVYNNNYSHPTYLAYDAEGKLIEEYVTHHVYYTYDKDGNLIGLTSPAGYTANYTRNSLGQLTAIGDGTRSITFAYDGNNRIKSMNYPNGTSISYTRNAAAYPVDVDNGIAKLGYSYDAIGQLISKSIDGVATEYSYDSSGRLTSSDGISYSYSTAGNLLNDGSKYNSVSNQLLSTVTHTFKYDAFGNLTKKTNISTGSYKEYSWNDWDQLIVVESFDKDGNSVKRMEFTYGALGRRVIKKVDDTTIYYMYAGDKLIAKTYGEYNGVSYTYLNDDVVDTPLMTVDIANNQSYYYHYEHPGSVVALTDESGNVAESYSYDAYGKTIKTSMVETGNSFAYTGREMDDEDLYYYRARYYDPTIGRFLSEDTIGFASGDFNLYRYVLGNPVNLIDPYGYGFWGTIGALATGAGVAILATGAAVVSVPAAIGAGAGLMVYTVGKGMYDAGQTIKTIMRKKKENAKIDDPIERYEANKKINTWGLKKAKKLTEDMVTAPGTGLGGDPLTSVEDVVVTVINAVAGETIYASDYKKKRKHHHRKHYHRKKHHLKKHHHSQCQ